MRIKKETVSINTEGDVDMSPILWKKLFPEHIAAVTLAGFHFDDLWPTNIYFSNHDLHPIWGTAISRAEAMKRTKPYLKKEV